MSAPRTNTSARSVPPRGPYLREVRTSRRYLVASILALFLLLGLAYSLVVPAFETPDEPFHYGFARHIAEGNGLPVQSAEQTGPWAQEGSQAPLYYLLTGFMTSWIDQSDFEQVAVRNPRANIGDPLDPGNKNFMLYSGRQGPLAGSNLALHIGRWFSLLLGAITLLCVYWTTVLLAGGARPPGGGPGPPPGGPAQATPPRYLPLLAAALVAAIPQFGFISASFTNDTLVMAASAATIYWLARLLAKPADQPVRAYEWLVLGILLGVAALSKLQGLGLVPLAGLAAIFLIWRRSSQSRERKRVDAPRQSHERKRVDGSLTLPALKEILGAALLVGLPLLLIAGWWYVRNIQLYGDWSGLGHLTAINGARAEPLALEDFWPEFRGLRFSFWGLFGWFNILLPPWFYTLADALTVAGVLGLIGASVQIVRAALPLPHSQGSDGAPSVSPRHSRLDYAPLRVLLLLLAWAGLMFLLLLYWITQATGSQGRLIFPGLIAYGPLLALGLDFWLRFLPARLRLGAWVALLLVLLGVSIYSLGWLLPAAYNAPQAVAAPPATAQALDLRIGDVEPVQLVAVEVGAGRYHPGERVPVTLYWRTAQPLTHDYQLFIQFLDETGREVANLTSHPGWGRNPTTFWQPGALYPDPYQVLVTGLIDSAAPLLARVYTGLIDPASEEGDNLPLPAYTGEGTEVTPFVGTVELAAWDQPGVESASLGASAATFGGVLTLLGRAAPETVSLDSGAPLTVTLLWEASGPPATDYTAYVHLLDANGQQVAGYDQAPAGERFPTRHWRAGDRVLSTFPITLPPHLPAGEYQWWAGLYETRSAGALRLPVTDAGGLPAGDGQVEIGRVQITPNAP